MLHWQGFDKAMASPWRRQRTCVLIADGVSRPVALRAVDGRGAALDSRHPPQLGALVELRHPEAGSITARVSDIGETGFRVRFASDETAIAFALAAIAADMTRGHF